MTFNARDAIRNSNRGKGRATRESPISNARYTVADGNGGEGSAISEAKSPIFVTLSGMIMDGSAEQ